MKFFLALAAIASACPGVPAAPSPAATSARPNIILILADDMGFSDLGCYGSEIQTPHLDRLAGEGLRFTQFYNMPRCWPTRASLLTGLYSHQTGIEHPTRKELNRRAVTIAEALRAAGYRTAMSGKWHLSGSGSDPESWPRQRGFERYFGIIGGAASFYDATATVLDNEPQTAVRTDFHLTDAISDQAAAFIGELAGPAAPFFLYVAYTAPHWPLHARPEDIARYRATYAQGWDAVRAARHRRLLELGIGERRWPLPPREKTVAAWNDTPDRAWQAERMAVYAAQIDQMDRGIGRILERLREAGAERNTLVLFLADNGGCAEELGPGMGNPPKLAPDGRPVRGGNSPAIAPGPADTFASYGPGWANVSNTPFRLYKHWVHEGGIATPLIAWGPGVTSRGGLTAQPGHVIDLMATCLEVAGADYPETYGGQAIIPLEGRSLLPVLQGGQRAGHEALFWEHEGNRAVRQGKWKLVFAHSRPGRANSMHANLATGEPGAGEWELYDLEHDRTETRNLASAHPALVRELAEKYDAWAARVGVAPR